MRRARDRQPARLFRGTELPRLMTMVVMLGVIYMLFQRARDESMWEGLARLSAKDDSPNMTADELPENRPAIKANRSPEHPKQSAATPTPAEVQLAQAATEKPESPDPESAPKSGSAVTPDDIPAPEPRPIEEQPAATTVDPPAPKATPDALEIPPVEGAGSDAADQPNDLDPEEWAAAEQEFEAVFDKDKLAAIDMPAYWRLFRWAQSQTAESMRARGRKDLLFTHLWEQPEQSRGQLVRLNKLHLRRILTYPADSKRSPDIHRIYEAWGYTTESKPNYYVVLFADLPKGMPLGPDVQEEVTFAGYFLKIMPYTSKDEKSRGAPLLIGRVIWHEHAKPAPATGIAAIPEWQWGLIFGGGVLVLLLVLQWLPNWARGRAKVDRRELGTIPSGDEDALPIEDWLEGAETIETLEYADGHGPNGATGMHGLNGNGATGNGSAHPLRDRLDGTKDRDG